MGLFTKVSPPSPPNAPATYDVSYFNRWNSVLTNFFTQINGVQQLNLAKLNLDLATLPTEADVASLRTGDVYRDTTASNVLKVKP